MAGPERSTGETNGLSGPGYGKPHISLDAIACDVAAEGNVAVDIEARVAAVAAAYVRVGRGWRRWRPKVLQPLAVRLHSRLVAGEQRVLRPRGGDRRRAKRRNCAHQDGNIDPGHGDLLALAGEASAVLRLLHLAPG